MVRVHESVLLHHLNSTAEDEQAASVGFDDAVNIHEIRKQALVLRQSLVMNGGIEHRQ